MKIMSAGAPKTIEQLAVETKRCVVNFPGGHAEPEFGEVSL